MNIKGKKISRYYRLLHSEPAISNVLKTLKTKQKRCLTCLMLKYVLRIVDKINLFFKTCSCCCLRGLSYYFPRFRQFPYSKRCSSNNRSSLTMLKLNIIYKRCLGKIKSCLKRLKFGSGLSKLFTVFHCMRILEQWKSAMMIYFITRYNMNNIHLKNFKLVPRTKKYLLRPSKLSSLGQFL